jgi:hypothetical protein
MQVCLNFAQCSILIQSEVWLQQLIVAFVLAEIPHCILPCPCIVCIFCTALYSWQATDFTPSALLGPGDHASVETLL